MVSTMNHISTVSHVAYLGSITVYFCLDTQCVTLELSDGLKMSCDSTYTTGEGYVGDTCSFTCQTGYEFTGSHTRTCRSDGSWSGVKATCKIGLYFVCKMYGVSRQR